MLRFWIHCAVMRPGDVLDERFELIGHSVHGPLGDVVAAHDRVTRETVALRFGPPHSGRDEALARRLEGLAGLRVAGMVEVIAHGLAETDARYLALSRVDGVTARSLLAGSGITIARSVAATRTVLQVLADLHGRGIAHGGVTIDRVVIGDARAVLLEPAPVAGPAAQDVVAAGRLIVHLLTGRPATTARPTLPGRAPAALAEIVDELLAGTIAAQTAERRLAGLTDVDDVWRARAVDPADADITQDVEPVADTDTPPSNLADAGTPALAVKSTDRYELRGVIGQGGLGRVVLAQDRELARPVAIKELLRQTPHGVARFQREAMVTARLQHPGIVPVHDVGRWPNGAPYYAMKLVEGDDLAVRVRACPDLAARLALVPSVVTACEAMAYAHDQGVIHRDLKPSNIVIGEFGETMIVDWGLAKDLADPHVDLEGDSPYRAEPDGLTRAGEILGTPAYMAPEQARGEAVDRRTDVYALGALLFHVLAGRPPSPSHEEITRAGTERARHAREHTSAGELAGVPADLDAIVRKAMAEDPADRYPSARELASELRRFQAGQLVSARSYTLRDLLRRWVVRHRRVLAVAAAVVIAGLVLGAIALVRIVSAERAAQHARIAAETQRAAADDARSTIASERDRLAVLQAEHAVALDPTEALDWLHIDRALPEDLHARALAALTQAKAAGVAFARDQLAGRIVDLRAAHDRVFAVTSKGTLAIWDTAGQRLSTTTLPGTPTAFAVSDSGDHVVASTDRVLRWYTAAQPSPRELRTSGAVTSVAFAASSRVAFAEGHTLWWWDAGAEPTSIALDGSIVAVRAAGEGVIVGTDRGALLSVGRDGVRWQRDAHRGAVVDVVVGGDEVVSVGVDRELVASSARTGTELRRVHLDAPAVKLDRGPAGVLVLLEKAVGVWTDRLSTRPLRYGGAALCAACTQPSTSDGPELHVDRFADHVILRGHADRIEVIARVDARTVVSGDRRGGVRFWRVPTPATVPSTTATSAPVRTARGWVIGEASGEVVEIEPSGARTVIGTLPGAVTVVAARGDVIAAATTQRVSAWRAAKQIVDQPFAGTLRLSIDESARYLGVLGEHSGVTSLVDGQPVLSRPELEEVVLVVGTRAFFVEHQALVVADLAAGTTTQIALPFAPVLATELPRGRICVAALSGALAIVDATGRVERTLDLGSDILSLASDGPQMVAGGADGRVLVWRDGDAAPRTLAAGHERWVNGVDVVGERVVTWSRAATLLRTWTPDEATGAIGAQVLAAPLRGAALDGTGAYVLSTDSDGTARIVPTPPPLALPRGGLASHIDTHGRR